MYLIAVNPLCTSRLFHYYMLYESICHCRGAGSIVWLLFYFLWKILLANNVDPDQTPHYVAPDLSLHCLHMVRLRVSRYPLEILVKGKMVKYWCKLV